MQVRLGFVAMSMRLLNCSPSGTITLGTLNKLSTQDKIRRLWAKAESNIKSTLRIIEQAVDDGIFVYRLSSKLIPFATHEIAKEWDYIKDLSPDLEQLSRLVKKNGIRISAHPDHFTVINTPREDVFVKSLEDLNYHNSIFEAMGLNSSEGKLVLHVGGTYKNKDISKNKFIDNFKSIPLEIQKRIILENDDKSFNSFDVLEICKTLNIPMVFDVHHYNCNNQGEKLQEVLNEAFNLWGKNIPKIHFSSPKSLKEYRSHAAYIDSIEFMSFIHEARELKRDFDIMIEAKEKDKAVLKLVDEIRNNEWINFNRGLCQFSLE